MSKLTETKRAYDRINKLINDELLKRGSDAKELRKFQETLDVAFYLLGWAQFEHLLRQETTTRIEQHARAKTIDGIAWKHIQTNIKILPLRRRLDMIFHANRAVLDSLHDDYEIRNDAAHNYGRVPQEAHDISEWLKHLEGLVDQF